MSTADPIVAPTTAGAAATTTMTVVENKYSNTNATNTTTTADDDDVFSPQLLSMYYARLFPFDLLHQWLSYNHNDSVFARREFSMTIEPMKGEEIYIRYQSFCNQNELKEAICKRRPTKIDIGAVYNVPPKDKHAHSTVVTEQRELVFDIDLTDYDDIRQCGCSGANICTTCWTYMTMAIQVLDEGLKEDFGFQHVGWFYSGRRGVHCWVSDESARFLTNEARSAVAQYFEINLTQKDGKGFGSTGPLHPMIARAYQVLEPMFIESVLPSQNGHGLLASPDQWEALLQTLPSCAHQVRDNLTQKWNTEGQKTSPAEKWDTLKKHLQVAFGTAERSTKGKLAKHLSDKERAAVEHWPVQVVLEHTYPRLDINVSKMQNHLLKSPFCVHPKTGRVCVPLDVNDIEQFDPFRVPTLPQLMKELDQHNNDDGTSTSNGASPEWHKTSLQNYFGPFQKQFLEPLRNELRRQQRDEAEQQAALTGDF